MKGGIDLIRSCLTCRPHVQRRSCSSILVLMNGLTVHMSQEHVDAALSSRLNIPIILE